MPKQKKGQSCPAVRDLQQKLKDLGFDPKGVDGHFGPGTLAAVIAFQKSKKLRADGLVGLATLAAIRAAVKAGHGTTSDAAKTSTTTDIDDTSDDGLDEVPDIGVGAVAKMFPGVPIKNIEENLSFVLKALEDAGLGELDLIL